MNKVYITNHHILSPLGDSSIENFNNLLKNNSGIKKHRRIGKDSFYSAIIDKNKGDQLFAEIGDVELYTPLERLMILSVSKLLGASNFKINSKTGLIISTTKGNIDVLAKDTAFYKDPSRAYLPVLGEKIQGFFKLKNPAIVVSNACVSGVLAVAVAKQLMQADLYEDVIIVSGDLVSDFIVAGFESFQAISSTPCRPYSKNRDGITIGEAIASVLMRKTYDATSVDVVEVVGNASCNDANHISGPSRTGEGLFLSIQAALKEAKLEATDIDYVSAHGTATIFNDEMESIAFQRAKLDKVPVNSLKAYYGHTLGASGLLETVIGLMSLHQNTLISSLGFDEMGVSVPLNIIKENHNKSLSVFLKTASGFGGSNTALILKKNSRKKGLN
ncbi:MAG: beta-ketoacyl synthase [Flavobacteriaceae bacterium]|nr:beta-ketoacyl synthase [Flavobacteriaceae bacterium]